MATCISQMSQTAYCLVHSVSMSSIPNLGNIYLVGNSMTESLGFVLSWAACNIKKGANPQMASDEFNLPMAGQGI